MACHIRITGKVDLTAAKALGEIVADTSAQHVRSPGPGIYLVDDGEDDLCEIESFCVTNGIAFERVTARPSQMGQEAHKVSFRLGMAAPEVTYL